MKENRLIETEMAPQRRGDIGDLMDFDEDNLDADSDYSFDFNGFFEEHHL